MLVQIIATLPKPSQEFKNFCNSLRCPLCNAQLDGNIHPKEATLYCVTDNNEYRVTWFPDKTEPECEFIVYTYSQYQYVIEYGTNWLNTARTIIGRYDMDAHPSRRARTRKDVFEYKGRLLFFRKRMDEEVFLEKLKTYTLFS